MKIDYDHSKNHHELPGPRRAFNAVFDKFKPKSIIDVGCGIGTWLKVAQEAGIMDVVGVDGVPTLEGRFCVSPDLFLQQDLTQQWNLGRRFDAAICLEVVEHLDEKFAPAIIDALVAHSDYIVFSAACPGQSGQHHVNCQWPKYWQKLFNERGYVCSDEVRWKIWDDEQIEVWYRQNMFVAQRDIQMAGNEPRIFSVIHPTQYPLMADAHFANQLKEVESGWLPLKWYLWVPLIALLKKIIKKFTQT